MCQVLGAKETLRLGDMTTRHVANANDNVDTLNGHQRNMIYPLIEINIHLRRRLVMIHLDSVVKGPENSTHCAGYLNFTNQITKTI